MNSYVYHGKEFVVGEEVRIFTGGLHIATMSDYRGRIIRFLGDWVLVDTEDGCLSINPSRLHKLEEGKLHGFAKPKI